jgi:asparagine synthase (glutamine-hydrolysing)
MCGISGIYHKNNIIKGTEKLFLSVLNHRGPDAKGVFMNHDIMLCHNRLSIIDLSSEANQPYFSNNKRYCVIYNGEIYNYKDIAEEIKQKRNQEFVFKTSSDTEVIVEAFSIWGLEFIHKLRGMFSIVIFDTQENDLYIFNDRIGIKPLFYSFQGERLIFSSELKTFSAYISPELSINENAINLYLHMGFIPAPFTIYNEVKKISPGSYLHYKNGRLETHLYWELKNKITKNLYSDNQETLENISSLISSSVKEHLVSDVPVGIFLSGGIDSSLITAIAADLSTKKINTFSIGFEENKFNESVHAAKIARYLGTNHNEYILSNKMALGLIDELIDVYDEPFADSSALPTMIVSKLAKEKVTVALSGDGGDELFLGYGAYTWANRLNNPAIRKSRHVIATALAVFKDNRKKRASKYFNFDNGTFLPSHILSQEQNLFSAEEVRLLRGKLPQLEMIRNKMAVDDLPRKLNPMEVQALFDIHNYLPSDLLTKIDRASMRYSLETRVPLLDHRVLEMSINISTSLKNRSNESKYILKQMLYKYIPSTFFERPKRGFAIPLEEWLSHELKEFILDHLNADNLKKTAIIKNPVYVNNLCNQFYKGETFLYNRLWTLAVLHYWKSKSTV